MEKSSIIWYIIEAILIIALLFLRDFYIKTRERKNKFKKILSADWDVNNPIKYKWNILKLRSLRSNNVFLPVNRWSFEPSHRILRKELMKGLDPHTNS